MCDNYSPIRYISIIKRVNKNVNGQYFQSNIQCLRKWILKTIIKNNIAKSV